MLNVFNISKIGVYIGDRKVFFNTKNTKNMKTKPNVPCGMPHIQLIPLRITHMSSMLYVTLVYKSRYLEANN